MKRVIFICTGNTCRSPMAQGLFQAYLEKNKITGVESLSAGIYCADGEAPSENAVSVCSLMGVDISAHRSHRLCYDDFRQDTFFICMTVSHRLALQQLRSDLKIMTLNVSDPFGGDIERYKLAAQEITSRFGEIIEFINAQYTISRMTEKDIPEIAEIEKECFSVPWSEQALREELDNPVARFFVAKSGNKVAGYIGAFDVCGEVSITNVAVRRLYRNRGIATKLIKFLEEQSVMNEATLITLEVRESNETARRIYEANGFQLVGKRMNFYDNPREDAVLMTKFF